MEFQVPAQEPAADEDHRPRKPRKQLHPQRRKFELKYNLDEEERRKFELYVCNLAQEAAADEDQEELIAVAAAAYLAVAPPPAPAEPRLGYLSNNRNGGDHVNSIHRDFLLWSDPLCTEPVPAASIFRRPSARRDLGRQVYVYTDGTFRQLVSIVQDKRTRGLQAPPPLEEAGLAYAASFAATLRDMGQRAAADP